MVEQIYQQNYPGFWNEFVASKSFGELLVQIK
jgi:hypothetical protein